MKLFLINWGHREPLTADIAHDLETQGHQVLYWVRSNKNFRVDASKYPHTIIQDWNDAMACRAPQGIDKEAFPVPSKNLLAQFAAEELLAVCLLDRDYPEYSATQKSEIYHDYFRFWYGLIFQKKPDVIVFSDTPHRVVDFMIYSVAKKLGLPVILFGATVIGDRSYIAYDYDQGFTTGFKPGQNARLENLSVDIALYYKNQTSGAVDNTPIYMKQQDAYFSWARKLKRKLMHAPRLLVKMDLVGPLQRNLRDLATYIGFGDDMIKKYCQLQKPVDYNSKYVYVPLHYQPERTTMPQGGVFMDQILMVRTVAAALPAGWNIYVKEHRSQWYLSGRRPSQFRASDYYERLAQIRNVTLISANESSFKLIKSAQAVVTVTGTAGWESVLRNVPSLIFGAPWYQGCPGTFRVSSVEDCHQFFADLQSGYKISQQEIIDFLYFIDCHTFHGYLQTYQHSQTKLTEIENRNNILTILLNEIEKLSPRKASDWLF
ncbi:MAG: hypothetical protein Q7K39_05085 [Candidatus Magasanikbacteria bacterium]|nr:hypothetical protein [Candidatus Magasanikbacteria bacterium]